MIKETGPGSSAAALCVRAVLSAAVLGGALLLVRKVSGGGPPPFVADHAAQEVPGVVRKRAQLARPNLPLPTCGSHVGCARLSRKLKCLPCCGGRYVGRWPQSQPQLRSKEHHILDQCAAANLSTQASTQWQLPHPCQDHHFSHSPVALKQGVYQAPFRHRLIVNEASSRVGPFPLCWSFGACRDISWLGTNVWTSGSPSASTSCSTLTAADSLPSPLSA